ncbi:proposed amino acid ligase found clustered with an amidotransferase [Geminocystis sp. NIES-3708]|uniref:Mur ligase family protein n=1 Tax=Geminocystis sp. NIES-3708 TaxID=1615909 RepID=UPI0005FCB779|nr:Mur ligase family protein [Geminocystis sp. NIES-3708]BAQ60097.1 proposed amino acid ligase found clustered with an amidotransferase [Geminocystis sp. NIES-3708]
MNIFDRIRLGLAVAIAKIITGVVKTFKLGAASVLPGEIAGRLHPQLLRLLSQQLTKGLILVVGTNGKTTTSLLLKDILVNNGYKIIHNSAGANLINGLVTCLIMNSNLWGKLTADYAILEVDENVLPLALKQCNPTHILALNLFRDQLDRYGEVDTISYRWQNAIEPLSKDTFIIVNGDDPTLCYLGQNLSQKVLFFGLNEPELYLEEIPHAVDSIYCPKCGTSLIYEGVYLSHLGDYDCPNCDFTKSKLSVNSGDWQQILIGVYNKYNTLAAGLVAETIGVEKKIINDTITNFKAAFGRAEELTINNKKIRILLSKNPVGMNETIRAVNDIKKINLSSTILMVLNDRIPDGTDVSWIWDVDTEKLVETGGNIVVSGDRVYDMALRLKYSLDTLESDMNLVVKENLAEAVNKALDLTPVNETLYIIPTYSAMLEVRKLLLGREIL